MGGHLHPAVAAVRRAVRTTLADLAPGERLLVACSGGADSMALAAAAVFEGRKEAWQVAAAVVDHQLQPRSGEVAALVAARLRELGYRAVDVLKVTVGDIGGPEAAARTARYEALLTHASSGPALLLLGHTRDDQAETVLLGLVRGSGTRSLAGMPTGTTTLRRPLLGVTRATTRAACAAEGIHVWDDPHNADHTFLRARVRHRVLPVLEAELGPGVAEALARTARLAAADADLLDELAATALSGCRTCAGALEVAEVAALRTAVRHRVLRRAAVDAGAPSGELFAAHVDAVDALVVSWHGQGAVDLPGSVQVARRGTELVFHPGPVSP